MGRFEENILIFSSFRKIKTCSKSLALLEYQGEIRITNIFEIIFYKSGLSFLGGFILAALGLILYLRKYNINIWFGLDAASPALLLGYGVGRLGCHFSGDGDWGVASVHKPNWWIFPDWMWGFDFPNNVSRKGILLEHSKAKFNTVLPNEVYPTSFYEAVIAITLCILLVFAFKRIGKQGLLFSILLVAMGIERFLIEFIRVNPKYEFLSTNSLSQAQYISFGLMLLGIFLFVLRSLQRPD